MKISVVIPTLNSERTIGIAAKLVLSITNEVRAVDSYPIAGAAEISEKEGTKVILVKG